LKKNYENHYFSAIHDNYCVATVCRNRQIVTEFMMKYIVFSPVDLLQIQEESIVIALSISFVL